MRNHGQELVGARSYEIYKTRVLIITRSPIRLKVLKDEIKKPYFISLKEFLWKEGVQEPDESAQNLKVYPARKFPSRLRVLHSHHPDLGCPHGCGGLERSAEYLFMVELYPSWQSQSRYDWPRPLPRAWSSARYAKLGASHPCLRCNRLHDFFFTNPPPFATLLPVARQVSASRCHTVSLRHPR